MPPPVCHNPCVPVKPARQLIVPPLSRMAHPSLDPPEFDLPATSIVPNPLGFTHIVTVIGVMSSSESAEPASTYCEFVFTKFSPCPTLPATGDVRVAMFIIVPVFP